jgi:death on curing protein
MKAIRWLDERDALIIHERLLVQHGGLNGVRDLASLQAALARPKQHHSYAERVDIVDLAALYIEGIVRSRPFADGNTRTGFVLGILFLELNGYRFTATEEDAAQAVIALAAGKVGHEEFTAFLRASSEILVL